MTAYDWFGSLGLVPLGYVLAGPLGDALGAQSVIVGGAILAAALFALGLAPRETRTLKRTASETAV